MAKCLRDTADLDAEEFKDLKKVVLARYQDGLAARPAVSMKLILLTSGSGPETLVQSSALLLPSPPTIIVLPKARTNLGPECPLPRPTVPNC